MLFVNSIASHHKNRLSRTILMMKKNVNKSIANKELKAIKSGLSFNFLTKATTDIRYGENIVYPELFILEFILGYYISGIYQDKEDRKYFSIYKSIIWSIITIILPSLLHDNNFTILQEPLDYIPYVLLLISKNNKNNQDIKEDKKNSVCLLLSIILISINLDNKFRFFLVF